MFTRSSVRAIAIAVVVATTGCTVQQASVPSVAGPSDFALSLSLTATPDSIVLDGSQSAIVFEARDASGGAQSNLPVRLDILVGGTAQDCGQLSSRNLVTNSTGRATTTFTAPGLPLPFPNCAGFTPGSVVTIVATPSGSNFQTANQRTATIRLVPPGVILPPGETPTAAFTVSPTPVNRNVTVIFDASTSCGGPLSGGLCNSQSQITSYTWDFGDRTAAASGRTATHEFAGVATYNVTLTVTNDRGISASTTQQVVVSASAAPTAEFVFSPSQPVVGQSIVFNGDGSRATPGHNIVQYTWVWGDGTSNGSGSVASHTFTVPGTYTVTLTVRDDVEQITTVALPVVVGSGNPTAAFTVSPGGVLNDPVTVTFNASASSAAPTASISSYSWSFGDGTSSGTQTAPTISHLYSTAGTFTITLTVTDNLGRNGFATTTITVQ